MSEVEKLRRRLSEAEARLADATAEIDRLRREESQLEERRRTLRRDLGRLSDAARAHVIDEGDMRADLQRRQERLTERHGELDAREREWRAVREDAEALRDECVRREGEGDRLARRLRLVAGAVEGEP